MIKEIKTGKFEGLAVLVPNGFKGGVANMGYLIGKADNPATLIHEKHFNSPYTIQKQLDRVGKLPEFVPLPAIKLPDADYKILGKATELTEEQCAELVPRKSPYSGLVMFKYLDYSNPKGFRLHTAKESFDSLMQSIECYSVNPYAGMFTPRPSQDDESKCLGRIIADVIYNDMRDLFLKAETNTGTWLILQKLTP